MLSVQWFVEHTDKNEFFPEPTIERWREISDAFRKCSHFPNCLGAIDEKHIRVTKFLRSGSMNLNYRCYFSIVLMAIADSDYKFTCVDIGAYGKDCDSSVFQETAFFKLLIRNQLHIPPSGPLFTNDTEIFPFCLSAMKHFRFQKALCSPMQDITSPKNKECSITVYVGHEDTSHAPLVSINGEFFIQH